MWKVTDNQNPNSMRNSQFLERGGNLTSDNPNFKFPPPEIKIPWFLNTRPNFKFSTTSSPLYSKFVLGPVIHKTTLNPVRGCLVSAAYETLISVVHCLEVQIFGGFWDTWCPMPSTYQFVLQRYEDFRENWLQIRSTASTILRHSLHVKFFFFYFLIVDGGWSVWAPWTVCTVTCGNGTRSRNRTCDNPPPQHGGLHCPYSNSDDQICYPVDCPSKGSNSF